MTCEWWKDASRRQTQTQFGEFSPTSSIGAIWTPTILEVKPLTDGGLRTGARYRVIQPKLRPAVYEVVECVSNKAFTWVPKFPGGEMIADHRISARDGQTEVELSFCSNGWLANIISMAFSKTIRDYVATEIRSLRQQCETHSKHS